VTSRYAQHDLPQTDPRTALWWPHAGTANMSQVVHSPATSASQLMTGCGRKVSVIRINAAAFWTGGGESHRVLVPSVHPSTLMRVTLVVMSTGPHVLGEGSGKQASRRW